MAYSQQIKAITKRISSGSIGFRIEETMSGHHEFVNGHGSPGEHPIEFRLEWGPSNLLSWLNPLSRDFLRHPVEGTLTAGGLCEDVAVQGSMALRYVTERKIRYSFDFDVDGQPYHFHGAKSNLRLSNLHRTHTTLRATITDRETREVVSEAVLYFYWSTLPAMLMSFRLQ